MTTEISAIIICLNESAKITKCLESLKWVDEIIVLDSGSTDNTIEIARQYTPHIYVNTDWQGFGVQKNRVLSKATKPWVLSIDADEYVTEALAIEIRNICKKNTGNIAYNIPRKSSFCGQMMRFSGWYPDYVLRLFKRNYAHFSDDLVHEKLNANGSVGKLSKPLFHNAVDSTAHARSKMYHYARLGAKHKATQQKIIRIYTPYMRAAWTFFNTYCLRLGVLDRIAGLKLAAFNAGGTFLKYAGLRGYQEKHKKTIQLSLIITTYNWPDALERVLATVRDQQVLPDEVIIADDGSTESTRQLIEAIAMHFPCPIQHVWQSDEGFRASSIRNKAIAKSQGNYLIFIDGDCLLTRDFIWTHLRLAEPGYFIAGNRVLLTEKFSKELLSHEPKSYARLSFMRLKSNQINRRFALTKLPLGLFRKLKPKQWQGIKTCNVSFYKKDLLAINGFDEQYIGWGYEDSDLIIRLLNTGIKRKAGRHAATIIHLWHPSNLDHAAEKRNHQILEQTLKTQKTWIENGLSKHLST